VSGRRGPGQVVQSVVCALAVDHPSPRGHVEGRASRCIIHLQHCNTRCISFQRRLCLSRAGFVNASLPFMPCPTRRFFFLALFKNQRTARARALRMNIPTLGSRFPPFPFSFCSLYFEVGGSVLFQLPSHAPSCPGFHLRHTQHQCEKVPYASGMFLFLRRFSSSPALAWILRKKKGTREKE